MSLLPQPPAGVPERIPLRRLISLREGLWVEALPSCVSGDVPGMKIKTDSLSQPQVTVLPPPSDAGFLSQ